MRRMIAAIAAAVAIALVGCGASNSDEPSSGDTPSQIREQLDAQQWAQAPIRQFYVMDRYLVRYDDRPLATPRGDWTHVYIFANEEGKDLWVDSTDQYGTHTINDEGENWVEVSEIDGSYPPFEQQ